MPIKEEDFKEYESYKKIFNNKSKSMQKITEKRPMLENFYYWDSSSPNIMFELDMEKYDTHEIFKKFNKLKKVHEIFKQGYVNRDEIKDEEIFNLLMEHLTVSALRYSLINRKPFILLNIRYNKLDDSELKCIFEFIVHTRLYSLSSKYKDAICPVKLGWWYLKSIIEQYKQQVQLGIDDYSFQGEYKW